MNNQEYCAEIITMPTLRDITICCFRCQKVGHILSYVHFVDAITRVKFWCEQCKHVNKNSINLDMAQAPEIQGAPFIPMGVIKWEVPTGLV